MTNPVDPNTHCENILNGELTPISIGGKFTPISKEVLLSLRDEHGEGGRLSDFLFVKLLCYFPDLVEGKEAEFKQTVLKIRDSSNLYVKKQAKAIDSWIRQEPTLRRLFTSSPSLYDQTY